MCFHLCSELWRRTLAILTRQPISDMKLFSSDNPRLTQELELGPSLRISSSDMSYAERGDDVKGAATGTRARSSIENSHHGTQTGKPVTSASNTLVVEETHLKALTARFNHLVKEKDREEVCRLVRAIDEASTRLQPSDVAVEEDRLVTEVALRRILAETIAPMTRTMNVTASSILNALDAGKAR
jgi:hypothetical protein